MTKLYEFKLPEIDASVRIYVRKDKNGDRRIVGMYLWLYGRYNISLIKRILYRSAEVLWKEGGEIYYLYTSLVDNNASNGVYVEIKKINSRETVSFTEFFNHSKYTVVSKIVKPSVREVRDNVIKR